MNDDAAVPTMLPLPWISALLVAVGGHVVAATSLLTTAPAMPPEAIRIALSLSLEAPAETGEQKESKGDASPSPSPSPPPALPSAPSSPAPSTPLVPEPLSDPVPLPPTPTPAPEPEPEPEPVAEPADDAGEAPVDMALPQRRPRRFLPSRRTARRRPALSPNHRSAAKAPPSPDSHPPSTTPPRKASHRSGMGPQPVAEPRKSNTAAGAGRGQAKAAAGNPEPRYPRLSRRLGEQGTVWLRVFVDAQGRVTDIRLAESSGHRRLDNAARSTVRHWRFSPARRNGRPVPSETLLPVRFELTNS